MNKHYSKEIAAAVCHFLAMDDWKFEFVDNEDDIPAEAPDEEDSVIPDTDAFVDDDDIADLLRMLREMQKDN